MRSVTLKSAMTPSRIGLMAVMLPGVRPSISFASLPTASICALTVLNATMEGSLRTMPRPRANTQVLAVPRSIARSFEKIANAPSSTGTLLLGYGSFIGQFARYCTAEVIARTSTESVCYTHLHNAGHVACLFLPRVRLQPDIGGNS